MKKINKSNKLKNVKYAIRGKILEEANKLEKQGKEIIKLNIGNPATFNLKAPYELIECMKDNLEKSEGYSDSRSRRSRKLINFR